MDHQTLMELKNDIGETPGFCYICNKWFGESKLRRFMGKDVCFTCYKNFKLFLEGMTTDSAIKWFFKRINAEVNIKAISQTEYSIEVKSRER